MAKIPSRAFDGLKIGKIAQKFLRGVLENGKLSIREIKSMQTRPHSKKVFGINFPLLDVKRNASNAGRYYADPLSIEGKEYYLCNHWFEENREHLLQWLNAHGIG